MSVAKNRVDDLSQEGEWVSIRTKVLQLWDANSDSINQVGLLGDESGKIKFVSWKKAALPKLEEGKSYLIKGAVVDSWNGDYQVNLNSRTSISELDEEIEVEENKGFVDRIIGIVPKSGYIERCPECNRVLVNNHCPVHIEVDPVEDIRVKASLRNKDKIAIANGEVAEELLGISLEKAKEIPEEDMKSIMHGHLVGRKFRFIGKEFDENVVVNNHYEMFGSK
ncbi:MAG: hypothetical protein ACOC5D_03915 [Thermoplasmatota archaeon]